jgi:hypothetical protein
MSRGPQDLERVFALMAKARPDALLVLGNSLIYTYETQIAEFAIHNHLPSMFGRRNSAIAGSQPSGE